MKRLLMISAALSVFLTAASAYAISASDVESISIGTARETVYSVVGRGGSSLTGLKETYEIDSGGVAVMQYDEDTFVRGFVIE